MIGAEANERGRALFKDERVRIGLRAVQQCLKCYPQFLTHAQLAWDVAYTGPHEGHASLSQTPEGSL